MNCAAMARRTRPSIGAVKAHNPILDVARALGLDVRGRVARCIRPEAHAHGDRSPSLWFHRERFKCFGCGLAGDVVDLVRELRGGTTDDAAQWLADRAGLPWREAPRGRRPRRAKPGEAQSSQPPPIPPNDPQDIERNISDGIRRLFTRAREARAVATAAGPNADGIWPLLADAARWELSAENLAAKLDELCAAEQARGWSR